MPLFPLTPRERSEESKETMVNEPVEEVAGTATPTIAADATGIFKPKEPKFGGLVEEAKDKWTAWTGGKPKADWTGLEQPNPTLISSGVCQ